MNEGELPLERMAIRRLVDVREGVDRLERALVVRARLSGLSWREIGEDLGISLQSAWSRHASADPRRRRRANPHEEFARERAQIEAFVKAWRADDASAPPEGV